MRGHFSSHGPMWAPPLFEYCGPCEIGRSTCCSILEYVPLLSWPPRGKCRHWVISWSQILFFKKKKLKKIYWLFGTTILYTDHFINGCIAIYIGNLGSWRFLFIGVVIYNYTHATIVGGNWWVNFNIKWQGVQEGFTIRSRDK